VKRTKLFALASLVAAGTMLGGLTAGAQQQAPQAAPSTPKEAGQAAGNVVKEEDLPYPLRIIRPADGIPSYEYEPNRLTLVLSEAGQIVDAAWD